MSQAAAAKRVGGVARNRASTKTSPAPHDPFHHQAVALLLSEPSLSDGEVAARIVAQASTRATLLALLYPLAVRDVQHARRQLSQEAEARVIVKLPGVHLLPNDFPLHGSPRQIDKLLNETLAVPGQFRVAWRYATIEQIAARATYLRLHAEGTLRSVDRCQRVIDFLLARGLTCLNEAVPPIFASTSISATAAPSILLAQASGDSAVPPIGASQSTNNTAAPHDAKRVK